MADTRYLVGVGAPVEPTGVPLLSRLVTAADRNDRRRWQRRPVRPGTQTGAGPIAGAWALAKIAVVGLGVPIAGALVAARAAVNTAAMKQMIREYPGEVERVLAGEQTSVGGGRVGRIDARSRIFISSDLHRGVAGASDWPSIQNTKGVYETALEHYGAGEWSLVENGDVEDFWLVGGSTYGVVYDVFRMVTALLPHHRRHELRHHLYGEHLRHIIDNNRGIYDRIDQMFHRYGRYHRLVGNHDDCYLDERVVDHLRVVHEGIDMHDFLVLDSPEGPVAVLIHGHHTDSWNSPERAGLGRFTTSMASAVADVPFLSINPGTPGRDESERLLAATHTDELTVLNPALGFNSDLYTLDEGLLHDAFEHHTSAFSPQLLLGHTHLPVSKPSAPGGGRQWNRYLNSGDGVHHELITGLEWDGASNPAAPEVRLVAWHYADEQTPQEAVVAEHDGRPVARRWFEPAADGRTLQVFPPSK